jgi:DNA-binding MarR family transcriptional regulator
VDLRQLFDDLVRFETDLWNGIDTRLRRDCGVPLGNLNVMMVIEQTSSCRVNDIAAALSMTVGGASQAVDRLEKVGHCARSASPTDRRSSIVAVTDSGRAALAEAGPVFDEELRHRLGGPLSPAALGHLGTALATLRAATPRAPAPQLDPATSPDPAAPPDPITRSHPTTGTDNHTQETS